MYPIDKQWCKYTSQYKNVCTFFIKSAPPNLEPSRQYILYSFCHCLSAHLKVIKEDRVSHEPALNAAHQSFSAPFPTLPHNLRNLQSLTYQRPRSTAMPGRVHSFFTNSFGMPPCLPCLHRISAVVAKSYFTIVLRLLLPIVPASLHHAPVVYLILLPLPLLLPLSLSLL